MKIYIKILIALFFSLPSIAQEINSNDLGKIALSVVVPDNAENLSYSQLGKLESRIQSIVAKSGLTGSGYYSNFVIYPKFEIYEESVVEGLRNITVVETEVNLMVKQLSTNIIFSTFSKSIKGSGKNKGQAINNAIKKLSSKDPKFKTFIEEAKKKIIQHYNANCDQIISKANTLTKQKLYKEACVTLLSVPEEVISCYNKVEDKIIEVYKIYAEQYCKEQLQRAKAENAANNYDSALYILSLVDPTSSCNTKAQSLIKSIVKNIDKEEEFTKEIYKDELELRKLRINAVKEIAKSYYANQPKPNYITIIK